MLKTVEDYYNKLFSLAKSTGVTDREEKIYNFYEGIELVRDLVVSRADAGGKMVFIGNGGSAAVSSHMATDFCKNGGIKAITFNDGSLLTCISNDYGYKHVFEKPIEMFMESEDVLFAISSSGKSENIIRGAEAARSKGARIITLSGFLKDNTLRSLGDFNFYVASSSYGLVEVLHHSICHCILDSIINRKTKTT